MSAYELWLGTVRFPIAPETITTKVDGNNKTINLINEAEVNQIKGNKLTQWSFDLMLPGNVYPFAMYENGVFVPQKTYLDHLEKLKNSKKAIKLKVLRNDGKVGTYNTSQNVTLESYELKEDANDGYDITVSVELKQYKAYGTTVLKLKAKGKTFKYKKIKVTYTKKKILTTYTTKAGSTLHVISKKAFGTYTDNNALAIYTKNKKQINNALKSKFHNKYTKRVLTASLPKGIKLNIPQPGFFSSGKYG